MKILIKDLEGESIYHVGRGIGNVVASVIEKLEGIDVETITVDLDALVSFKVKGEEEPQHLMTDREIFGKKEIYTVIPLLDKEGNIMSSKNNEEASFNNIEELLNRELPTKAIKSEYRNGDGMRLVK